MGDKMVVYIVTCESGEDDTHIIRSVCGYTNPSDANRHRDEAFKHAKKETERVKATRINGIRMDEVVPSKWDPNINEHDDWGIDYDIEEVEIRNAIEE